MKKTSRLLTVCCLGMTAIVLVVGATAGRVYALPEHEQGGDELSVKTPSGGLEVSGSVKAKEAGLPVYPGATYVSDHDKSDGSLLFSLTRAGKPDVKFVVAKFETTDSITQVRDFYRKKLGSKVSKFSVDSGDGSFSFEMKTDSQHAKFIGLKNSGGKTEIDLIRLEGFDISDTTVK